MLSSFTDPVVVYDILDDLEIFDADEVGMPEERRVRYHHSLLMESADVVIASAPLLVQRHSHERPDIILVENGVDITSFSNPGPVPPLLAELPRPVVGYHGMVARWFDFALVAELAKALPNTTIAIVGPVDPRSRADAQDLGAIDNVHFLGPMDSELMPAVVNGFDVGLIPFVVDDMTRAVSPLKMYEYLAGGRPVVATALPVCEEHPLVATGTADRFPHLVADALAASSDTESIEARQLAAQSADWDARIRPLLERLRAEDLLRVRT